MPAEVKLPKNAPPALRDFVACKVDTLDLDPADSAWIPVPPELGAVTGAPTVTVEQGPSPGSVRVTAAWAGGYVSMTLDVSVVDGNLQAQAQGALGEAMQGEIDTWLQGLNDAVRSSGKQFGEITLRDGKGTIRKVPAAAPAPTAVAGGGTVPVTPPEPVPPPPPQPPADQGGCLRWLGLGLIGIIGAGLIGFGALQLLDDEAPPSSEVVVDDETPPDDGPDEEQPPAEPGDPEEPAAEAGACGGDVDPDQAAAIQSSLADNFEEFLSASGGSDVWSDGALRVPCRISAALPIYEPCRAPFTCVDPLPETFVAGGYPAAEMPTSHNGSQPDAVTGEVGLSANEPFFFTSAHDASFRLTADCSGRISTSDAVPGANGIALFNLPLFQYGPCNATGLVMTTAGGDPLDLPLDLVVPGGSWTVGPEEYPAEVADLVERIAELEATTTRRGNWQAAQDAAGVLFEGGNRRRPRLGRRLHDMAPRRHTGGRVRPTGFVPHSTIVSVDRCIRGIHLGRRSRSRLPRRVHHRTPARRDVGVPVRR